MEIKNVSIKNYPILDACCGGRMFYFDKHDSRVLFQDIRDVETTLCDGRHFEVKPDIQADFTNMPYPDSSFSMVVFDPPHLVYSRGKKSKMVDMYGTLSDKTVPTGYQHIKYGALYSDWRDMLISGPHRRTEIAGNILMRQKQLKNTLMRPLNSEKAICTVV